MFLKPILFLVYLIMRASAFAAQIAPLHFGQDAASYLFGKAHDWLGTQRRHTQDNVARILKKDIADPEVQKLARQMWQNYGRYMIEFLRVPRLTRADLRRLIRIQGQAHLDRALAHPAGVIFVTAHFGNMDMGAATMERFERPLVVAADNLKPRALMDWTVRARANLGMTLIPNRGSLPVLEQALKDGGLVGLAVDTGVRKGGVTVKFFGQDAVFPIGPAILAKRTGAVIVPGCGMRQAAGEYVTIVQEPIFFEDTGDEERDIRATTQKLVSAMEKFIGAHPEQWYIFRPVWRAGKSANLSI